MPGLPLPPISKLPRRPLSTKKKGLLIALAILLLPVVYLAASLAVTFVRQTITTSAARDKVAQAREGALLKSDAAFSNQIAVLKRAGLIDHEVASSKVDVCYVTHSDRGWFAANWYQECYLRYVAGFTTLAGEVVVTSELSDAFGIIERGSEFFPCELAKKDYKETLRYRPANIATANETNSVPSGCDIPGQIQGTGSVLGPIMLDSELATKTFSSYDPETIDNTQNQLWVIHEDHYYTEELGCGVGVFCTNPRSTPVQAP